MLISVVIAVYNNDKYIARSIRSALNQSLDKSKYEVIVINDGSTDNTAKILEYFSDQIKLITLKKNKGLAFARNEGIRASRGRFIVNLDSDDYLHEDLLLIESKFLLINTTWDAVSCDYFMVNDKEEHIKRMSGKDHPIACGIMFRIERLIDIGLYDPNFRFHEDKELRIRFEKKYQIHNIELTLYRYRQHDTNMSKNKENDLVYSKLLKDKHPHRESK